MTNTNETKTRNVTAKELAQRFEGKHVDITPYDRYGMSITMTRATVEYDEEKSELWFVARDSGDRVMGEICFDKDSIESIETDDGNSFLVDFMYDMTGVDISETIF